MVNKFGKKVYKCKERLIKMLTGAVGVLVSLLVLVIVVGLVFWLVNMLPLPAPWKSVVQVIMIIIVIIVLLQFFLGAPISRSWRF